MSFIKLFLFLVFFLFSSKVSLAQESNLQIFYSLADSSALEIISELDGHGRNLDLNFSLGEDYSAFKNHITAFFADNNFKIINSNDSNCECIRINYVLDQAEVTYGDIYRDGFLGDYFLPRKIFISGNYLINLSPLIINDFQYSYEDTVLLEDAEKLESSTYSFTKNEIPPEPFFSSLFEPLIAIGTAAVAVFLFFTIRSK